MADYMITFEASGGMTVNAADEDEARRIFEQADKQEIAWNELKANGIDVIRIFESSHQ